MTSADEGFGQAPGGIARILIVLAIGTLAFAFRRRRGGGRQGPAHAKDTRRPDAVQPVPPVPPVQQDGNPGSPGLPRSQSPPWLDAEAPATKDDPGRRGGGRHAGGRESSAPPRNQGSHRAPAAGSAPAPAERAPADPAPPGQNWDAGPVQPPGWIVADASEQAAEIWREARDQAATSLADAQQEASELVRRASDQAAVTLAAAERQAAEIRANVLKLSAGLNGAAGVQDDGSFAPESAANEPPGQKPGRQASRTPGPTNLWPYA
jgi:hypothetical protein